MFIFNDNSAEIICVLSFSVCSSFLLGKTLCNLFLEIMNNKDAEKQKHLRHFRP
jgi:hypothetical protein